LAYVLPNVAKLSRALQAKQLDLSLISSLVESTLHTLDDAVLPAANWVLELHDQVDDLQKATEVTNHGNPFIACLKENISSRFRLSHDFV
jgi:hypothetical protein